MSTHRQRILMQNLRRGFHGVGTPFLQAGAVEVFFRVLWRGKEGLVNYILLCYVWGYGGENTSNVIHEMGWSVGISVFLRSSNFRVESSNWTVKIAPGGVLCLVLSGFVIMRNGRSVMWYV